MKLQKISLIVFLVYLLFLGICTVFAQCFQEQFVKRVDIQEVIITDFTSGTEMKAVPVNYLFKDQDQRTFVYLLDKEIRKGIDRFYVRKIEVIVKEQENGLAAIEGAVFPGELIAMPEELLEDRTRVIPR